MSAISISAIGAYTVYTSEVSIELQTSVVETIYIYFQVFPYVFIQINTWHTISLIVMLNNLSYIHHFAGTFENNQHSFHDDNNHELLDAIIFSVCLHISQPGNVFQKITHR